MNTLGFDEQQQKMKAHPGFIAALDQSGGSTPDALRLYGIKAGAWSNEAAMWRWMEASMQKLLHWQLPRELTF